MKVEKDLTGQLHTSTTLPLGKEPSPKDCLDTWQERKAIWPCQYCRVGSVSP